MNFCKKNATAFLCIILSVLFSLSVFAASATDKTVVSISNETAFPGESVTVSVDISDNPGIKIMSFCITYDNSVLEYVGYEKGYLKNYTVQNYTADGNIIFLSKESSDVKKDGTIIYVNFKIKDGANSGKSKIALANRNEKYGTRLHNSFYTDSQKYIEPTVKTGGVTVGENCETAGHKFGEWTQVTAPTCTSDGLKKRTCLRCLTHYETEKIPAAHDFETEWTVDRSATPQIDGIMSRHCKNCDAVTDEITFSYTEIGENTDTSSSENSDLSQNTVSNSNIKIPLNNTVGEKNDLNSVKDLNGYIQNVKPKTDTDTNTDTSSDNITNKNESEFVSETYNVSDTNSDAENNITQSNVSNSKTVITAIALTVIISLAVVLAGVIIIKYKNKKTDN